MDTNLRQAPLRQARKIFRDHGGLLRMSEAIRAGIHRRTLRLMLEQAVIEKRSRGLYRLADTDPPSPPDLAIVAAKVPQGVICLISALVFQNVLQLVITIGYVKRLLSNANCVKFLSRRYGELLVQLQDLTELVSLNGAAPTEPSTPS